MSRKICSRCKANKPITEFSKLYGGLQYWCRNCSRSYRIHRKVDSSNSKTHLYVLSYASGLPDVHKVGQSSNIEHRVLTLESSHLFRMKLHAVYPFQGFLETRVRDALNPYRITGFRTREWFACSLAVISQAITDAITQNSGNEIALNTPRTIDSYFGQSESQAAEQPEHTGR